MLYFASYKEAHEKLKIPGSWQRGTIGNERTGITSIKLTANPKSLDRITADLKTVYYVGRGKKLSPGEPQKSQQKDDQQAFYTSLHTKEPVHVMAKLKSGFVAYLGKYRVVSVRLVPWSYDYYQIKLVSMDK